jgi:two-component system, cell cycle sensor histidine kinase and response regulator CckA
MYGMSFANVGLGITGGYVWTIESSAAKLAELTVRVANGTRPQDIPVVNGPDVPMFDWRQLRRWGIREDRLPAGSIVRFREFTVWQRHKWRIVGAIVVFGLQTLLIGALLVERRRTRRGATALRRAQRVLRESEERFRNMADTAPVMIWVSGPDKLWTFFNKGWLTFTGRTMAQELGNGWTERVHPDDLERCSATYSSSFDTRSPFQTEYRLRRADGEYRSLLCTGMPRFQEGGIFAGYIGSCMDITELKRTQEKAVAGQKLESMGQLASGIAHDFNNLLGGILACAEVGLSAHAEGVPIEEELRRIKAAAIGGAEIVRELMVYGGKHSPAFEPVDCSLLVRDMLQLLKVSISKYAFLKTDLAEDLPMVPGNPAQLRQLVMNLVINASEAIGEREGVIRVTTKMLIENQSGPVVVAANLPAGDYLELEVADTGGGMTEEAKARIFDPFFTTKPTGRGLGLAVVQGVIRAHNGLIRVASAPGSGAAFQVLLPCMTKEAEETHSVTTRGVTDECLSGSETVLIIEDEDTLRLAVSKMLRKKGFTVMEAANGDIGADLFLANAPEIDVVLLDMTLPGKSGREILGELQQIRPDVKVIITSAYGRDRVRNSLAGLRGWSYVQKPYRLGELGNLLRAFSAETQAIGHEEN